MGNLLYVIIDDGVGAGRGIFLIHTQSQYKVLSLMRTLVPDAVLIRLHTYNPFVIRNGKIKNGEK